jgi:hypothetical protein
MMTPKDHEDFDRFMDSAVAALQAKLIATERKLRDDEHVKAFEELLGDDLLRAYERLTPTEKERERHFKRFRDFQKWVGEIRMPYSAATAGLYLLDMLMIQHRSVADLKAAAASIKFVHSQAGYSLDEAFIEAALDVATEIASGGGDNGGGQPVVNDDPPPPTEHELPMAAGAMS